MRPAPFPNPSARIPPSQRKALLELVLTYADVRILVATWPNAYVKGMSKKRMIFRWSLVSGLREIEILNRWRLLFDNGICKEDGTVDQTVDRLLESLVWSQIPAEARKH